LLHSQQKLHCAHSLRTPFHNKTRSITQTNIQIYKYTNIQIQINTMSANFKNGACGCCGEPGGCGTCLITACCPCYSFYKAAEDIGDTNGVLYCVGTLLGFGCCMLTVLGDKVAQEANIEHGIAKSACCACFDCCVCYSCSVANEAALIKSSKDSAPVAAEAEKMNDRA
jgi:hypothetical protein